MRQSLGFRITSNKGFHVTFANGYTVSVQFGPGNYCDNHDEPFDFDAPKKPGWECMTAQIAAWDRTGEWYRRPDWDDNVHGWVTPDEVLAFMNEVAALGTPVTAQ